ncbi:MAG TPA: hypothetical protein VN843_02560, partial [Anaerolineales bacterium]|nr:hypothetical protein [Anaerolineales bacterium]
RLIAEARTKIDQFMREITDPRSFIYAMFRTQKKEMFNTVAEQMEIERKLQGKPINTIANELMRMLVKARAVEEDYTYIYDVLPACYKSHTPNPEPSPSVIREADSSKRLDCRAENKRLIDIVQNAIQTLKDFAIDLEENHLMSHITSDEDLMDLAEFESREAGARLHLRSMMDKRTAVSPLHKGQYYMSFAEATENELSKLFFLHARRLEHISGKQSHNILYGLVTDVPYIFDPSNMAEAMRANFIGTQCRDPRMKGCESWRVKVYHNKQLKRDMHFCHKCKEWFNIQKMLLPGPADKAKRSVQLNYRQVDIEVVTPGVTATVNQE